MKILLLILSLVLLQVIETQAAQSCSGTYERSLIGICIRIEDCEGAVIGGNCVSGLKCCVPEPSPITEASNSILTKNKFLKIIGNTTRNNFLYSYLVNAMEKANVRTEFQIAAFLSQLMGETDNFKSIESSQLEDDYDISIGNINPGEQKNFVFILSQ